MKIFQFCLILNLDYKMEKFAPIDTLIEIISNYSLCSECLGRQFALLGTHLSNKERARSMITTLMMLCDHNIKNETVISKKEKDISENSNSNQITDTDRQMVESQKLQLMNLTSESSKLILKKIIDNTDLNFGIELSEHFLMSQIQPNRNKTEEFTCYLCNNIFYHIDDIVNSIIEFTRGYEFHNFLIGSSIHPQIQDREDEFRAHLNISTGESFKKNINRVVGIKLNNLWNRDVEFSAPEFNIQIKLNLDGFSINILSNPLCIKGRYHKYERGIPQTHWPHRACHGRGCEECNYTGKQYETSVEELITPFIQKYAFGTGSKFHGAGREDIDARCIGSGRPFIVEIKNPHTRTLPLDLIEKEIKETVGKKVDAINLEIVPRSEIMNLKSSGEKTTKTYSAFVESEQEISKELFDKIMKEAAINLKNKIIDQRTPTRVSHRRADKVRQKKVYGISGDWVDSRHFQYTIEAMGGTYIKELISGDSGRTNPSLSEIFGTSMVCKKLDVINVQKLN